MARTESMTFDSVVREIYGERLDIHRKLIDKGKAETMPNADTLDPQATGARRFQGKIAIVTGAGQGIGRATAKRLAQEGAAVVVADVVANSAQQVCEELGAAGASATAYVGDLTRLEGAQGLAAKAVEVYGRIDVLVNIVGGTIWFQPFEYYTPAQIEAEVQKSFWSPMWCCWSVLPTMIEQRSGAIVNLGTHAVASRYRVPYVASKGGGDRLDHIVVQGGGTVRHSRQLCGAAQHAGLRPGDAALGWDVAGGV